MKNNKLHPVEIHDLFTYQFPGNLQYSPDDKFLAFEVKKAREKENDYTRMCIVHGKNHELSRNGKPEHRIRRLNEITNRFISHTEKKGK